MREWIEAHPDFFPPTSPVNADLTVDWPLRLLGPDDAEVSSDLIYLDEATGGVVGVPQAHPACDADEVLLSLAREIHQRAVCEGLVTPGFLTGVKLKVST